MTVPPGPRGRRLVGNLADYEADRLGFVRDMTGRYGGIWSFSKRIVVVTEPELVGVVLRRTDEEFGLDRDYYHRKLDNDPKLTEEWACSRAVRMRGMRQRAIDWHVPMFAQDMKQELHTWGAERVLDVVAKLRVFLSQLGARFCFGPAGSQFDEDSRVLFRELLPIVAAAVEFPRWFLLPSSIRAARAPKTRTPSRFPDGRPSL